MDEGTRAATRDANQNESLACKECKRICFGDEGESAGLRAAVTDASQRVPEQQKSQHPQRKPRDRADQPAGDAAAAPRQRADEAAEREAGAEDHQRDEREVEGAVEDADVGHGATGRGGSPLRRCPARTGGSYRARAVRLARRMTRDAFAVGP